MKLMAFQLFSLLDLSLNYIHSKKKMIKEKKRRKNKEQRI